MEVNTDDADYEDDVCYECGGYGDDYDEEGNSNCPDCPHNEEEEEWS